jgi:hypothetical protein
LKRTTIISGDGQAWIEFLAVALYKKIFFSYGLMAEKYIKKYKFWLTSRSSRPA